MTYDDCHKLSCMEILECMHVLDEDIAMHLHSSMVYHVCANLPEKVTHCLFVSVLYSVLLTKQKHMNSVKLVFNN